MSRSKGRVPFDAICGMKAVKRNTAKSSTARVAIPPYPPASALPPVSLLLLIALACSGTLGLIRLIRWPLIYIQNYEHGPQIFVVPEMWLSYFAAFVHTHTHTYTRTHTHSNTHCYRRHTAALSNAPLTVIKVFFCLRFLFASPCPATLPELAPSPAPVLRLFLPYWLI